MPGENLQPTPANQTQIFKDLMNYTDMQSSLGDVGLEYSDAFLTFPEQLKQKGMAYWERMGGNLDDKQKEDLAQYTRLQTHTDQFFNAYRSAITGAAAAMQELEFLQNAVINMNISPTQFKARWEALNKKYSKAIRLRNRLAREGFADDVFSDKANARFGVLFMGGADDDADAQAKYLVENLGYTEADAVATMDKQGY
jgi:hypothetical protein